MEIGDGRTASAAFFNVTYGDSTDEEKKRKFTEVLRIRYIS